MVRSEMYFCQFGIPLSRNQFNNLSSWSITAAAHDCMMKGYYARLCGHSPYTLLIGSISERMGIHAVMWAQPMMTAELRHAYPGIPLGRRQPPSAGTVSTIFFLDERPRGRAPPTAWGAAGLSKSPHLSLYGY